MTDTDTTSSGHGRARLAQQIRAVNPRRLAHWSGYNVAGALVNPYAHYADRLHGSVPRSDQIAELLIGDVFADALLHPELKVSTKDGCIYWPHRGRQHG